MSWLLSRRVLGVGGARPLAHGAVLRPRLGAHGTGWRRLHGWRQRAEEASDECEAQATPGAEHGPAVTVGDIVGQSIQVAWVAGKLKVDGGHTSAEGDNAEGAFGTKTAEWSADGYSAQCRQNVQQVQTHSPPMRKSSPATYCMRP